MRGRSMDYRVAALAEIREHADEYAVAWEYADGKRTEVFANPTVARALRAAGIHFNINIARRPIDAVLDRLSVAAVTVVEDEPAEDGEPTPDTSGDTMTDLLEDALKASEFDLEWPDAMRKALGYGDGYLFVEPPVEDGGMFEMYFHEPTSARLFYDPESPRRKMFYARTWDEGKRVRLNLYFPDRTERWITAENTTGAHPQDWLPYVDESVEQDENVDEPHIELNEYGVVPAFHLRPNARPYGRPEHQDVFGAQDAVTKLLATLMSTVDYHGAPQRYALQGRRSTDDVSDIFDGDDDDTVAPSSDMSNLQSGPGQLWLLKNVDAIGQLAPADVDAFMKPVQMYVRFAAAVTATPIRYFEPTAVLPSGAAQDADESSLLKKCETHEKEFGGALVDALEYGMLTLGHEVEVSVRWEAGQSVDDLEGWQAVNEKIKAGVPVRQALIEAGYTAEQVDAWLYDHDENDMRRRIEVLVQLGQAVQSLGSGVALGVLTADAVGEVIASVLPDTGDEDEVQP